MKLTLLPSLAAIAILSSSSISAQKNTAYAVTGEVKGNFTWNVIREIDLSTGEVVRTVYDPAVNTTVNYKAVGGADLKVIAKPQSATGGGVAAAAFDVLHNRLYFTDMRNNELKYFDFNSQEQSVIINNNQAF